MFNFRRNREEEKAKKQKEHREFVTSRVAKMAMIMKEIDDYTDSEYSLNGVIETKTKGDSYIIAIPRAFARKLIERARLAGDDSIEKSIIPTLYKSYSENLVMAEEVFDNEKEGRGNCPACKSLDAYEKDRAEIGANAALEKVFAGDSDLPFDPKETMPEKGKVEFEKMLAKLQEFTHEHKKELSSIKKNLPETLLNELTSSKSTDLKRLFRFTSILNKHLMDAGGKGDASISIIAGYSKILLELREFSIKIMSYLEDEKKKLFKERKEILSKLSKKGKLDVDSISSVLSSETKEVSDSLLALAEKVGKKKIEDLAKNMNLSINWKNKKITKIDSK